MSEQGMTANSSSMAFAWGRFTEAMQESYRLNTPLHQLMGEVGLHYDFMDFMRNGASTYSALSEKALNSVDTVLAIERVLKENPYNQVVRDRLLPILEPVERPIYEMLVQALGLNTVQVSFAEYCKDSNTYLQKFISKAQESPKSKRQMGNILQQVMTTHSRSKAMYDRLKQIYDNLQNYFFYNTTYPRC